MKFLQSYKVVVLLVLLIIIVVFSKMFISLSQQKRVNQSSHNAINFSYDSLSNEWHAPDEKTIPGTPEGSIIKYGKELIASTSKFLGPQGKVAPISNGMNCQNCHIDAGTKAFANAFSAVASTYPKYRERSGQVESIEFRINDCLLRSLNGQKKIDSLSKEMRAMVSYLKWVGKDVPKGVKPKGAGVESIGFLQRAASPAKGKIVYLQKCQNCHGKNGEGQLSPDATGYIYPPLWGKHSFNTGAGLYRLSSFAGYVKNNMPFGASYQNPQLTNEEAWDVAAFVNSQPRPEKHFTLDWPDITKKPFDFPFGPYADSFSETQHKFGPFDPIKRFMENHK